MKNKLVVPTMILLVLFGISGCKEKGDSFIGKWERVDKKHDKDKEDSIVITREDGVFQIERKHWGFSEKYETEKLHARAESEKILSSINGGILGNATFSLEGKILSLSQGAKYKRTK